MKLYAVCIALAGVSLSCGKKTVTIDDAEKPATLTLTAPANTGAVRLHVRGLLSGTGRLKFYKPDDQENAWKTLELMPVVVSGIPMGVSPAELDTEYSHTELIIVYQPDKKTQGHLEIEYEFMPK